MANRYLTAASGSATGKNESLIGGLAGGFSRREWLPLMRQCW